MPIRSSWVGRAIHDEESGESWEIAIDPLIASIGIGHKF